MPHEVNLWNGKERTVIYSLGTGGGGDITGILTPPAGHIWVLQWCLGFHTDNTGARVLQWRLNDQVSASTGLRVGTSVADNIYIQLYDASIQGPLTLEYLGLVVNLLAVGIAAAKTVEMRAMVIDYAGMPTKG